jgi:Ca2+-binding EF-hand superfamily protein
VIRSTLLLLGLALVPACTCKSESKKPPEPLAAPDRGATEEREGAPAAQRGTARPSTPRDPRAPVVPSIRAPLQREARARLLEQHDRNGDGALGDDERAAMQEQQRDGHLASADIDGNGEIDPRERQAMRLHRAAKMVSRMDADGDGRLTEEEVARARGRRGPSLDFEAADTDHDGTISTEEMDRSLRKHQSPKDAPQSSPSP